MKKIYLFVAFLIALVPLGLLTQNPAWGEWDISYFKEKLGFIPKGIKSANSTNAIIPDYAIDGLGDISSYYLSAIIGVILIFVIFFALKKVLKRAK